mmetsp:Transcript_21078/g.29757  ORF Transcript_21078/g.29757 Transcript_21078/m.29757 type:complete len:710 (+) Transcript_21078:130-2259(+)
MASASVLSYLDEDDRCLHCQTQSLHVDWAAGDRVCTNCGVVHEDHIRDDRPEWREFNDDNDRAKGGPALARCGAVVDETRYVGGLEPTSLSRTVFGGSSSSAATGRAPSGILVRKKLIRASRKIDSLIDRHRKDALNEAKLVRKIHHKRRLSSHILGGDHTETDVTEDEVQQEDNDNDKYFLPEHEQLLIQEEEDAHRAQEALNSDRWSLERAILLHGTDEEQITKNHHDAHHHPFDREAERDELLQRLDKPMKRSASDLYQAYSMLNYAFRKLHLPERVLREAITMLCKYAARKDGFSVRGVSSRLSTKDSGNEKGEKKQPPTKEETEAMDRLREFNKAKQMASLGSALLYLTARNLGWARPLAEVCSSFHQKEDDADTNASKPDTTGTAIKAKHCSKAINEIKGLFPDYVRPVPVPAMNMKRTALANTNSRGTSGAILDVISTGNFVDYATRKLDLPPVALASIRSLVAHCRKEQINSGVDSGTKLSIICASVTYFVCSAGATMQKLAQQAESSRSAVPVLPRAASLESDRPTKRQKTEAIPVVKKEEEKPEILSSMPKSSAVFDGDGSSVVSETSSSSTNSDDINIKQEAVFDVFSHAPVDEDPAAKQEYEARRIWDAWSEQMPWSRTVAVVEQSCGVSRKQITEHYKKHMYPQRQQFLELLKKMVSEKSAAAREEYAQSVREAPLSSVLLGNINSAAGLLSNKVK